MILKRYVFPHQLGWSFNNRLALVIRCLPRLSHKKNLGVTLQPNFYAMLYFSFHDRRLWKHFLADTFVGAISFSHTCRLANLETYLSTLINPDRRGRGIGLQTGIRSHADVFKCLHHTFLLCPHEWFLFNTFYSLRSLTRQHWLKELACSVITQLKHKLTFDFY